MPEKEMKIEVIQTKCFRKLIKVVQAWKNGEFTLEEHPELEIIQKILNCSRRTAYDYYYTLETIIVTLGSRNSKELPNKSPTVAIKDDDDENYPDDYDGAAEAEKAYSPHPVQ